MGNPKVAYHFKSSKKEDKIYPQDIELEEVVLGAIILEFNAVFNFIKFIPVELFYKEANQLIYKAILDIHNNNEAVDILTVTHKLRTNNTLESIGGAYYVTKLTSRVVSSANIQYHIRILYQLYLRRKVIEFNAKYMDYAFNDSKDIFDNIDEMIHNLQGLIKFTSEKTVAVKNRSLSKEMINELINIQNNPDIINDDKIYLTGDMKFDSRISICKDNILLISGPAHHGKTRYSRHLLFKLLKNYPDEVAIDWITLESSAKEMIRGYISQELKIKTKDIRWRNYDKGLNQTMLSLYDEFSKFDIEFTEVRTYINTICDYFVRFCEKRPKKLNILLIDNILAMEDHKEFKGNPSNCDDYIMAEILKCRQETKGLIIPVHHYKSSQQDKEKGGIINAYRPVLTDMKGSEAYQRVPNQVLLINNPGCYKDLVTEFPKDMRDILRYIFIVDPGKNRDDTNNEETILRYITTLDYGIFQEI